MALRGNKQIHPKFTNRIVTQPAIEPVTVKQVKDYLRLTPEDFTQDNLLADQIVAARAVIESQSGFAFITQTWKLTLDHWPGFRDPWWDGARVGSISELYGANTELGTIIPTKYPLQTVDTLTVYDEDSNATSVTVSTKFDVDTESWPGRVALKSGQTWPVALRRLNAIEFGYTAGFGTTAKSVPDELRLAVTMTAAYMYDNRGKCCSAVDAFGASGAGAIVNSFKQVRI